MSESDDDFPPPIIAPSLIGLSKVQSVSMLLALRPQLLQLIQNNEVLTWQWAMFPLEKEFDSAMDRTRANFPKICRKPTIQIPFQTTICLRDRLENLRRSNRKLEHAYAIDRTKYRRDLGGKAKTLINGSDMSTLYISKYNYSKWQIKTKQINTSRTSTPSLAMGI
jgi:hypothetical protein